MTTNEVLTELAAENEIDERLRADMEMNEIASRQHRRVANRWMN